MMPNTRKILIIDDDPELRGALTEQLSLYEEYEAVAAENGNKGVQAAKAGQIDLVIMDVGLPDIDGREAVRILRRNGFKAPIIMLTGHDTDSDTILGLESGASRADLTVASLLAGFARPEQLSRRMTPPDALVADIERWRPRPECSGSLSSIGGTAIQEKRCIGLFERGPQGSMSTALVSLRLVGFFTHFSTGIFCADR
jgi:CheY-like chemotaxis protein